MQSGDDIESKIIKQFSRFAQEYDKYNRIQSEVAKILVEWIPEKKYECIVDLGCGSGEIYKQIVRNTFYFEKFIALDSSTEMLQLHPADEKIEKYHIDFDNINRENIFNHAKENTLIVSSSAMQWSQNFDELVMHLSSKADNAYFAIFTSNTFKTLHNIANLDSPIYSEDILMNVIKKHYNATFKVHKYQLKFNSVRDMFHYIKKSGVSGGEKQLTYKQIKLLMSTYPLNYLEFEVLYVHATPLIS